MTEQTIDPRSWCPIPLPLSMPVTANGPLLGPLLGVVVATAGPQGSAGVVYVHGDGNHGDAPGFAAPGYYRLIGGVHVWAPDVERLDGLGDCVAVTRAQVAHWAAGRWAAEVRRRSVEDAHKHILDCAWRQVIQYVGHDPADLLDTT